MSSTGSGKHNKRLASEADHSQRLLDHEHQKLKERQRFFEEVYQHDVDNYLPSSHLQIDSRKPPMGSISSMEVNVDVLEQMDLMDISDQEALDVFLNSGSDEGTLVSSISVAEEEEEEEDEEDEEAEVVYRNCESVKRPNDVQQVHKSRMSSTSSGSTCGGGADTPVIQSDDEEVHADTLLLTSVPQGRDEDTEDEDDEKRCLVTKS